MRRFTFLLLLVPAIVSQAAKPNFLIIVSDDQRSDTIGVLGNDLIETPNLDRLARDGTVFSRAVCAFPLCVPSRAEILTGVPAFGNGVFKPRGRLKAGLTFWGDALRSAGYRTVYCGKWMNDGQPKTRGYDETAALFSSGGAGSAGKQPRYGRKGRLITGYRGWTFKDASGKPQIEKGIGITGDTSRHIADGVVSFLSRKGSTDAPFFLHVNFTAPHDPLVVPRGYEGRYKAADVSLPKNFAPRHPFDHGNLSGRDEKLLPWPRTEADVRDEIVAYYAVISDMDHQIGRIFQKLKAAGAWDNTIIIFTSDHGLALGSHGLMGKQNMYEHTIGVPMLVAGKGIRKGALVDRQIYLRDMYPTTCELAGIEIPASVKAQSFASLCTSEVADPAKASGREATFGYYYDFQRMIRTERWKLIYYPQTGKRQLFDVIKDPDELRDLWRSDPQASAIGKMLFEKMAAWFIQQGDEVFQHSQTASPR